MHDHIGLMNDASRLHSEEFRITGARSDKHHGTLGWGRECMLVEQLAQNPLNLPFRFCASCRRSREKGFPEVPSRPTWSQALAYPISKPARNTRQPTEMLGQQGFDIRFELTR